MALMDNMQTLLNDLRKNNWHITAINHRTLPLNSALILSGVITPKIIGGLSCYNTARKMICFFPLTKHT